MPFGKRIHPCRDLHNGENMFFRPAGPFAVSICQDFQHQVPLLCFLSLEISFVSCTISNALNHTARVASFT